MKFFVKFKYLLILLIITQICLLLPSHVHVYGEEELENEKFVLHTCCSSKNHIQYVYDPIRKECSPTNEIIKIENTGSKLSYTVLTVPSSLTNNSKENFQFRLIEKQPNCIRTIEITLELEVESNAESTERGNENHTIYFMPNGFLKYNDKLISPDNFCINYAGISKILVLLCDFRCEENLNKKSPCLRKCCPLGQHLDVSNFETGLSHTIKGDEDDDEDEEENHESTSLKCIDHGNILGPNLSKWKPDFYYGRDRHDKLTEQENSDILPYFLADPPNVWCSSRYGQMELRSPNPAVKKPVLFRVLSNGRIIKKKHRLDWEEIPVNSYCIDETEINKGPSETVLIECEQSHEDEHHEKSFSHAVHHLFEKALAVLQLISACFLLATSIVYFALCHPEHIQKSAFTYHVTCLFFEYFFLATGTIYNLNGGKPGPECYTIGLAWHFFSLSSACWLFVINKDFFWEFHSIVTGRVRCYSMTRKRKCIYWIFSLSIPTIIVGTGLILNSAFSDDIESEVLIPLYGQEEGYCGLERQYAIWAYLFGPFGFLLSIDVVFLTSAYFYLKKIERMELKAPVKPISEFRRAEKVEHVFRILMVVGITYLYEVTYWAAGGLFTNHWYIWIPFEVIHGLHGIQIFFAVVWIRPVLASLKERYPRLMICCGQNSIDDKTKSEESSDTTLSPEEEKLHNFEEKLYPSVKDLY